MLKLLKNNMEFRKFWLAITISTIGDFVDDIAFAQLVYLVTGSTLLTSYVFAIKIICSFMSVFTSTFVDRHRKKNILGLSFLLQGITLVVLYTLCSIGKVNTIILLAVVTLQSVFSSFVVPTKNAMIAMIVDKNDIVDARASISIVSNIVELCSYALSGAIIATIGINYAILLDALTFFISILFIMSIVEKKENDINISKNFFEDVSEGFKFILTDKIILVVVLVTFIGNAAMSPVDALMPAYINQSDLPVWSYSTFMILTSLGGLLGGVVVSFMQKKMKKNHILAIGFLAGSVGMILMFMPKIEILFIAGMLIGISVSVVSVMNAVIIQLETPKEMQARAFSFFSCVTYIASPMGMVFAGGIGENKPMSLIFPIFGVIILLAVIFSALLVKEKNAMAG